MAEDDKEPIHLKTDDARAGATPHMTRNILAISLVLVVIAYFFIVFVF
ncbi:hypothetical protein FHR23_002367 [Stakelama sediminis]|uniref:Uncharacterized protein n=1 Tax=Stakelama sediminis TaxID=463200 RepID=A0A840Z134_9SPHN|nr:hypothetical protein [Stakelama sediminis]